MRLRQTGVVAAAPVLVLAAVAVASLAATAAMHLMAGPVDALRAARAGPGVAPAAPASAAVRPEAEALLAASRDIPLLDRLRGIERRPPVDDPQAFVDRLVAEGANIVTLGVMNGHGRVFFPTDEAPVHPRMDPSYLPAVTRRLHERGLKVLSWVVFNVQDVRQAKDFALAERYPQWRMAFLEVPPPADRPHAGMCVVSSPYIEQHAKVLRQAAALDIDGFFFDGFYLGGAPHPLAPGCVCDFCRERFKKDTGLALPAKVDWTDRTFKRWVRWRNERLLAVARYFQAEMRSVNPNVTCTFNYNMWPFGAKDWETAVPAWRIRDFGVSQHGYDMRPERKWLLPGFKARLGRDMNPDHTDMWRGCGYLHTCGKGEPDPLWHELEIETFILAGLSHGITPWHAEVEGPPEAAYRIHANVAKRERYFSRRHVADVAVLYSQNTHDFYGHIPPAANLADYRDGLLGTWMVLSEHHVPFEFVFDNEIEEAVPERFGTLVLANAAALSDGACVRIAAWVRAGGHLVLTADAARFDEWGDPAPLRRGFPGQDSPTEGGEDGEAVGQGRITYLDTDPGLAYCRSRDAAAAERLLAAVRVRPLPMVVEAPPTLVANLFEAPAPPAPPAAPAAGPRGWWIHLLNVSHLMPDGDSGFRGLEQPPVAKPQTGDPATGRRLGWPLVPARNVRVRLTGAKVTRARLAVAGTDLAVADDGTVTVPEVGLHEVVVLRASDEVTK